MDIVPWKSFGEISRLRREMDDLFTRIFGETSFPKIERVKRKQIKINVK